MYGKNKSVSFIKKNVGLIEEDKRKEIKIYMKVVVAIDSLKGSLSSLKAGQAIKDGILKAIPKAEVYVRPLADGGEGTVEALVMGMGGNMESVCVTGPLGEKVDCIYGILEDTKKHKGIKNNNYNFFEKRKTAIIEMSGAAGITLISQKDRNPLHTTTYGVGEVIKDAISKGCRHFIVGIGGSATNDGGAGMLQALGYDLLDRNGKQISFGAKGLKDIKIITDDKVIPELKECTFRIACDVKNPLCGEQGCSVVFAPQKGADSSMIIQMDQWLGAYARLICEKYEKADPDYPGTGAAGGLGFAFLSFMNAQLESGIKIVLEETNLEEYIKDADIVVTGEGRLDGQTVFGKAPIGVAEIAKKYGKPVIAFSGSVTEDAVICNEYGIDAFFPVLRKIQTLQEAMEPVNALENMSATVEQVFRLISIDGLFYK